MRTTMDIYGHVMPALAREAADRMGAVLLGDHEENEPARTPAIEGELQPKLQPEQMRMILRRVLAL